MIDRAVQPDQVAARENPTLAPDERSMRILELALALLSLLAAFILAAVR